MCCLLRTAVTFHTRYRHFRAHMKCARPTTVWAAGAILRMVAYSGVRIAGRWHIAFDGANLWQTPE